MPLIAINCGNQLSETSRKRLVSIVGDFTEICPVIDGQNLFHAVHIKLDSVEDGWLSSSEASRAAMDELIRALPIADDKWLTHEILILLASNWVTAGIDINQTATVEAIERRKGDSISWMVFGNGMLCDDEPMTSEQADAKRAQYERERSSICTKCGNGRLIKLASNVVCESCGETLGCF